MSRSNFYAVVSGKGGTGKTTVCAAVASALSQLGRRVCAIDLDIGLHNLDLALGLQDQAIFNLGDVAAGRADLNTALLSCEGLPNLSVLAAPADSADLLAGIHLDTVMDELSKRFQYCFIDAPAGIGRGFDLTVRYANHALVVSTPDTPSMSDSATAVEKLQAAGVEDARLVLNRVVRRMIRKRKAHNVDEAMDWIGLPLAGIVFENPAITAAFNRCEPLMLTGEKATADFKDIARRLEGFPIRPKF